MVEVASFHFEQPWWLLALILPMLLWWLPQAELREEYRDRVKNYADQHLLPFLLLKNETESQDKKWSFYLWSLIWLSSVFAMANPRWDYTDINIVTPTTDLVVLLDMSQSMEARDVKPSRMIRARQEIEDLLKQGDQLRVGLVGFASVAQVVAPVTDDFQMIRHILPVLSPKMVKYTGSRLSQALNSGKRLLLSQPQENDKVMLLISDGDYDEEGLESLIEGLKHEGIDLYVLGVGSLDGASIPGVDSRPIRDLKGHVVLSKLDEPGLMAIAKLGRGQYYRANYLDQDTKQFLSAIKNTVQIRPSSDRVRVWENQFIWPLMAVLLLLLYRFFQQRRGQTT
ncbi:MAG: VWA domain-containing protein [Methylococcales bacterium]|jgi:Ca-activated chloride channel homolog|nr:VWA domain-containing protein [Methylococcales bacterium]MBT7445502.1 VWA domain-containing protein [Methylococcales bacterium]